MATGAKAGAQPAPGTAAFIRGMITQRSTKHQGSKPWFSHRPDASGDIARSKAHTWSVVTGRPLPPHARTRPDKLSNAVPMTHQVRLAHYGAGSTSGDGLTPARRRRARRKLGRQLAGVKNAAKTMTAEYQAYLALHGDVG